MNIKTSLITSLIYTLSLVLVVSTIAESKDKKRHAPRGMVESMQSVPCGAKERGLAGLGSVFGSVGVQHVNSHEQLCTQYLFRTDEMEYHISPLDTKHAALLPVGHEGEFKIKKDRMYLRAVDGEKKARPYQVVSMRRTPRSVPRSRKNLEKEIGQETITGRKIEIEQETITGREIEPPTRRHHSREGLE